MNSEFRTDGPELLKKILEGTSRAGKTKRELKREGETWQEKLSEGPRNGRMKKEERVCKREWWLCRNYTERE